MEKQELKLISHQRTETGEDFHCKIFAKCSEVMLSIQKLPVPVIAKVSGLATAAGCQLVASCDIVIATESSKFSTPGLVRNNIFQI